MTTAHARTWLPMMLLTTLPLVAGCDIEVRGHNPGRDADVDIRTPLGRVALRTDDAIPQTGLPVYPGATPRRDQDDADGGRVRINSWLFDLDVAAAEFESPDAPPAIVAYYQDALARFGTVTVCRGEIDFRGRKGRQRPVCDEDESGGETQIVVGTERNFRMVSVKPRRNRSTFALVAIQTRIDN